MAAPLDPIQATSAAWERTAELMLKPFRFSFWWRMAFVAFITGEMSGGGGGNFNIPADWHAGSHDRFLAGPDPFAGLPIAVLVAVVLAVLIFVVVMTYLASVFRFVLFDAVLSGRYRLREGFARWQPQGNRFFVWSLGYFLVMLACFGVLALFAIGSIAGVKASNGLSILVLVMAILAGLLLLVAAVIFVLTKDFVIPIMAFEGVPATAAWGRLRTMITADPVTYLAYIGWKIVLAIGAGIVAGIATLILVVVLLIVGVIGAIFVVALHLTWNPLTIALAVVLGAIVLAVLVFVMGMISGPIAVFFQAYALYFFGRRFRPLEMVMYPEPPAAPSAPATPEPAPA